MHTIRLSVALLLLLGTIGCGKKDSTQASNPKDSTVPTAPSGESSAASLSAAKFVKAVQDGKATSDMLTPAFKKVIAPPELESDKAAGYSESGVRTWLDSAKASVGTEDSKFVSLTDEYAFAEGTAKAGKTFLRLMFVDKKWLVDYVVFSGPTAKSLRGGQTSQFFATLAFAEAIAAKNTVLIEALLTKTAKAKIAPPLFDEDKVQGFNRAKLKAAIDDLFSGKIAIENVNSDSNSGTIMATFRGGMQSIQVTLVTGRPGEFLIDSFVVSQQK